MTEMDVNDLRSIFKCGKICGQITKLAEMLKYTTNLEVNSFEPAVSAVDFCVLFIMWMKFLAIQSNGKQNGWIVNWMKAMYMSSALALC